MARMVKATVESSKWGLYWYVRLAVPNADRLTLASFKTGSRARSFRDAWNAKYALDFNADALQARIDYRGLLHNAEQLKRNLPLPTSPHHQMGGLGGDVHPSPPLGGGGVSVSLFQRIKHRILKLV